ncbi:hypothetical protein [Winogradskyella forsetii]|uniref:hypothetical protein n=1 Tax=Winogradskyella forsetii TaxID=2686077 RepID=UPI0015B9F838|nr:hypothetical protein [Winogradskyella forsetii]
MLSSLINILLKHNTIVVIGIYFETEKISYTFVNVSQKNNKLIISNQASYKSFNQVEEALEKKPPVILNFSGKGVLNKKTAHISDYRSKALLNVNKNDFYFYEYIQNKDVFISVIRKEKVLEHISMFNAANLLVIDYSVGPFIATLLSKLSEDKNVISNSTELKVDNDILLSFETTNKNKILAIDNQAISEKETALLASAINYFYPIETFQYENDFLKANKEEADFKKYFEILGVMLLGGFFSLLLISYLMLGHYNNEIISINSNIQSVQETYDIIKDLQKDRDNKKEILYESGVFTSRFLAYYINELTISIPKSITLNTFSLFPYDRKIKTSEKIRFEENIIVIKGESSSNITFNDWYKGLKKIDWISKSDIINYQANRTNNYDFEIKLEIR